MGGGEEKELCLNPNENTRCKNPSTSYGVLAVSSKNYTNILQKCTSTYYVGKNDGVVVG